MKESKKVLFISSEICPYLPETDISLVGRHLPQGTQEKGNEIRVFMPRYGCINERRNQLHEVIRLSGMNIVINEYDRPLIIKVSSISAARMQIYFIDNEDYFQRKQIFEDVDGKFFEDNDERTSFFARGVLETVKKLRWKPDIIHCQGWISHLIPIYLKKAYKDDPLFSDAKVVLSLYNEYIDETFSETMKEKILMPRVKAKDIEVVEKPDVINLAKLAVQYSDGVIYGKEPACPELDKYIAEQDIKVLPFTKIDYPENTFIDKYNEFYDQILNSDAN